MESYVIRIYRRYESEPEKVVGLVEHPENGAVERFSGVAELLNILLSPQQVTAATASLVAKKHAGNGQADSNSPPEIQNKMVRLRRQ
jgi:hypothetical protein